MDKVEDEKEERSNPSREGDNLSTDEGDRNAKDEGQLAWRTGESCLEGKVEIQVWEILRA